VIPPLQYPLIALLKLFIKRDNVEKEAKRVQRANKAARKGNSRSSSSKDYSKERSNKERST
jgi:hypothetical protein